MPSRPVIAVILAGWVAANAALLSRDVLPRWLVGPPPDFRTIMQARSDKEGPVQWTILADRSEDGLDLVPVGAVETEAQWSRDGWMQLKSHAILESKELLEGTPWAIKQRERLEIRSQFAIERSGNLDSFRIGVKLSGDATELLVLDGKVRGNDLEITAHGPLPLLRWKRRFPYQPRSMVQNTMGPLEFLPGLHVGQRWSTQMISPLTGAVGEVSVEVVGRKIITWDENPVTTYEVVTRTEPFEMRSWVRPDGLVLQQEIPFPLMRLRLVRLPLAELAGFDRPALAEPEAEADAQRSEPVKPVEPLGRRGGREPGP